MIQNKINTNIECLRTIAISIVVGYHYFPAIFPNGYLGVDIFFVISGFLIAKILSKSNHNLKSFFIFFYRRCRRILPSLIFMLLVLSVLSLIFLYDDEARIVTKSFYSAVTLTSNFYFKNLTDYFDPISKHQFLLHTWSLSMEIQFYLIIGITCIFLKKIKFFTFFLLLSIFAYHYVKY